MTAQKYKCPECDYASDYKAAVMNHIIGNHPGVWKGNWDATFGVPGAKPGRSSRAIGRNATVKRKAFQKWDAVDRLLARGRPSTFKGRERERKRELQRVRRAENIAKGLTSGGLPRKKPLKEGYLRRHGMVNTPSDPKREHRLKLQRAWYKRNKERLAAMKEERRTRTGRRIKPIVYRVADQKTVDPKEEARKKLRDEYFESLMNLHLRYCPNCGLKLTDIKYQIDTINIERHEANEEA